MNRFILFTILIFLFSCGEKNSQASIEIKKEKVIKEYGYTLNNYNVKKDTIESGDSFGLILEKNNLFYPKIYDIVQEAKKVFDIRKINIGRPYTILSSKDSTETFAFSPGTLLTFLTTIIPSATSGISNSNNLDKNSGETRDIITSGFPPLIFTSFITALTVSPFLKKSDGI